jgi:hypothetical protein
MSSCRVATQEEYSTSTGQNLTVPAAAGLMSGTLRSSASHVTHSWVAPFAWEGTSFWLSLWLCNIQHMWQKTGVCCSVQLRNTTMKVYNISLKNYIITFPDSLFSISRCPSLSHFHNILFSSVLLQCFFYVSLPFYFILSYNLHELCKR